jgi:hypothetical protein
MLSASRLINHDVKYRRVCLCAKLVATTWRYAAVEVQLQLLLTLILYVGGCLDYPLTALPLVKTSRYPIDKEQGGGEQSIWALVGVWKHFAVVENEFSYSRSPDSVVVTMATELLWFLRSLCYTSCRTDGDLTRSNSKAWNGKHFPYKQLAMYQSALCNKPQ